MSNLEKVKLLRNMSWHDTSLKDKKKGDIVEVDAHLAKLWIDRNCAEPYKESAKK